MTIPPLDLPSITDRTKMLNILRDGLISHDTRLQDLRNDVNSQKVDIDRLNKIVILGEGEREFPLVERVRNLERLASRVEKFTNAIILQTVAFLFTVIGMGLAFFIKVYPVLVNLANRP